MTETGKHNLAHLKSRLKQDWKVLGPLVFLCRLFCLAVIAAGVVTSFRMLLAGHSLWWDEAALARSLSLRSLFSLAASPLDLVQSAPVGWLYLNKLLTIVFGNTDLVLRLLSVAAYLGILILLGLLLSQVFSSHFTLAGVAFAASMPLLLQYSIMFKPYIFEAFCALIVLYTYSLYRRGRLAAWQLGLVWAVLVWFGNPVCFAAGGCILSEALFGLIAREKGLMKKGLTVCVPLGASFVLYYFLWLRATASDDRMKFYWRDWNFPLIPRSLADIRQIIRCVDTLFYPFYRLEYAVLLLLPAVLIYAAVRKKRELCAVFLSIAVALFASGLGMFPVNKRMWLFLYPYVILALFAGAEALFESIQTQEASFEAKKSGRLLASMAAVVMAGAVALNGGIRYYANRDHVFWDGYEVKGSVAWLAEHAETKDGIYVFSAQVPIFDYYNHYADVLESTGSPVYKGTSDLYVKPYDYTEDLSFITGQETCYLVMGDLWRETDFAGPLLRALHQGDGVLEMAQNVYDTPVFVWHADADKAEAAVKLSLETDGDARFAVVENTGGCWISPLYEAEDLVLVLDAGEERIALPRALAPGGTVRIAVESDEDQIAEMYLEDEYGRRLKSE